MQPSLKNVLTDGPVTLDNLSIPGPLIGEDTALVRRSITIEGGKFSDKSADKHIDMKGAMALPCFVDMHTHLDKGHIWPRKENPDGTFDGALASVGVDREANWSAEDVRTRMNFALESAYAYGTRAVRTHIDSIGKQTAISFGVLEEVRAEWDGKIDLQAVCLTGGDMVEPQGEGIFGEIADITINAGGKLGYVPYPMPEVSERIENFIRMAQTRDVDVDLHVDETGDPTVNTLKQIAQAVINTGYDRSVVCGHCCSLAVMEESEADRTMDLVAQAGINIVSLPMCNLYLQDRAGNFGDGPRTPRWRGATLVHELKARGVSVSFASDNTRDPFYAYGDLDMIEVMREATRIAHLDHTGDDWVTGFTTTPAAVCGFDYTPFAAGSAADFIVVKARTWNEFFARPQMDRAVIRDGALIETSPPDYAVLDALME